MNGKSRTITLSLTVAASIFLLMVGCGGGGGGSDIPFIPSPTDADLSLTKTVDIPTPDVDTDVVFTITVSNAGPANATGVVVTDQLPSGFTYVTDSSGGAYNPATGVWSVGSLSAGGTLALTITATVKNTGNYTNLADVTAANDSTPNNNSAGVAAPPPSINVSLNQIQTDCNTTPGATDVKAFATVVDQNGVPVTTLNDLTFTLTENQNSPVGTYDVDFAGQIPIPLSVSIVLDYSSSIFASGVITEVEDAAVSFIDLLSADDRAEIIKFNKIIQVITPFTANKAQLRAAIKEPFAEAAGTELYDATIKGLEDTNLEPSDNRKAIIVITDGDNFSVNPTTLDDVIDLANEYSIPVFPIGVGSDINVDDLTRLADETGGVFYQPTDLNPVDDIYQRIADALIINQFVFTYSSSLIGGAPATLTIGAEYFGLTDSDTRQFTTCP